MKLSKRLRAIAGMIEKHSNHGRIADIGSDHGYLPVWLVLHDIVSSAVACDIADGPLEACLATVQLSHTENKISVKKGDGLTPIIHETFETIAICGMGGNLICDILEAHLDEVNVQQLVLEANVNEPLVRQWLNNHHWQIIDEDLVEDMHHYYEIILACKGQQSLSEKEYYFGPVLLEKKGPVFEKKWQWQKTIHEHILESLPASHEKYPLVSHELQMIQEVLHEN